jgi:hypothetical protein
LDKYRPSWPKFDPWLVFSALIWVNFSQFGKVSADLDDIRPKSVAKIQLRVFDRFQTNFGQKNSVWQHKPISNKFSLLGAEMAKKKVLLTNGRTDGRTDDSTKSIVHIF